MKLYLGGAPGFRPGEVISPHPTKHIEGCEVCAAAADENHLPDRVFATPVRLYAKYYASKAIDGWLYIVEADGEMERSTADSIETYHAEGMRVLSISERAVRLTDSERRHLSRLWKVADEAAGFEKPDWLTEFRLDRAIGLRT